MNVQERTLVAGYIDRTELKDQQSQPGSSRRCVGGVSSPVAHPSSPDVAERLNSCLFVQSRVPAARLTTLISTKQESSRVAIDSFPLVQALVHHGLGSRQAKVVTPPPWAHVIRGGSHVLRQGCALATGWLTYCV
jgi:hypothetical protein